MIVGCHGHLATVAETLDTGEVSIGRIGVRRNTVALN
jgi:hypothetical protein